ncbi:MAG TPA: hypothetical protein VM282_03760 [Acidimicrobiales bacterium]|nr:hypothetical protein [Acidimicrobiales bacterium]
MAAPLDPDFLQREAEGVRRDLGLDDTLGVLGQVHIVGSAALGLMVRRDLDLTIVCDRLDVLELYAAGASLVRHPHVRELTFRNDCGHWNIDPMYPDGVYWGIDYREGDVRWNLDIWFVDEPDRQPDLAHVREFPARLTPETREAIMKIKSLWCDRPEYGGVVRSYDIYIAVLDHGVRTTGDFDAFLKSR